MTKGEEQNNLHKNENNQMHIQLHHTQHHCLPLVVRSILKWHNQI